MPEKNTVIYLDGIRGVAAFFVFLNHFCLAFYPAYFNFKPEMSHLNGAELYYQKSLFSFITNGGFQVAIFFILSGYVLSRKYLQSGDLQIPVSGLHRRFLRLWIPVAFTIIVSYLLLKANLITNHVSSHITLSDWFDRQWRFSEPGIRLFKSLIYGTMFAGDASFDTCLWTISYEFYGSLFIFSFLVFTHFIPRYRLLMMFFAMCYFYLSKSPFYMAFVLGISMCYTEQWMKKRHGVLTTVIAVGLLIFSLMLGSVPFCSPLPDSRQEAFKDIVWDYTPWCLTIGAYLLVLAYVMSPLLQKIVSFRPFRFLGYVSFSLYLIHPLILGSFSSSMFLSFYNSSKDYNDSVIKVFVATVAILLPISWVMARYVDQSGIKLAKKVYDIFRKPLDKKPSYLQDEDENVVEPKPALAVPAATPTPAPVSSKKKK
jgi:peptidoglycan/LPS O-acetylase OafA/YrhL